MVLDETYLHCRLVWERSVDQGKRIAQKSAEKILGFIQSQKSVRRGDESQRRCYHCIDCINGRKKIGENLHLGLC